MSSDNFRHSLLWIVLGALLFVAAALFWHISFSPFQYYFAFFVMGLTIVSYLSLESDLEINHSLPSILRSGTPIVISAIALTLLLMIKVDSSEYLMPLAMFVTAILPGYVLLELLPLPEMAWMERFVLSFVLSVPISSLIFLGFLTLNAVSAVYLSTCLFLLSLLPLVKRWLVRRMATDDASPNLKFQLSELLGLGLCAGLFIIALAYRYPSIAPPGYDIVRWLTDARLLLVSLTHSNPFEVFFLLQWSQVYVLSGPSEQLFQLMMGSLSFLLILSFYVMAKKYLGDINQRWAIFGTIVWTTFSGLGWVYYYQDAGGASASGTQALNQISSAFTTSFWDAGYGGSSWLWLWYRPVTLGFIMMFTLLCLLKTDSIGRRSFILISSLVVFGLHFSHYPEFVIFAAMILVISLLMPSSNLRLSEMLTSILIGTGASLALAPAFRSSGLSIVSLAADGAIAVGSFLLLLQRHRLGVELRLPELKLSVVRSLVFGVLLVYVSAVIVSLTIRPGGYSSAYQSVPAEYYPLLLGATGIIGALALPEVYRTRRSNNMMFFLLIMMFTFVVGTVITYSGLYVVWTGYYERRMIPLILACGSMLAPMGFYHIRRLFPGRKLIVIAILFVIMLGGTSSTFLSVEYQSLVSNNRSLSPADEHAISVLQNANTGNTLLTATRYSYLLSEYVPTNLSVNYFEAPLWNARSPEAVLNVLGSSSTSVFLTQQDSTYLGSNYPGSFLGNLTRTEMRFQNLSYPAVVNMPALGSPLQSASTVLVLQNESGSSAWNAFLLLSAGKVNYTTALVNDVSTWSHAKTLIVPDEETGNQVLQLSKELGLKIGNLIILNYGGYGPISHLAFSSPSWSATAGSGVSIASSGGQAQTDNGTNLYSFTLVPRLTNVSGVGLIYPGSSSQWSAEGLGQGTVGVPTISESDGTGNTSLGITVPAGNYSQWQISTYFTSTTDIANYDFVSFSWYGNGDGNQYAMQFNGPGFYYWYSFTDTWNGWKQVLLPMHSPDGTYSLAGVQVTKITKGAAAWSSVNSVLIRPSSVNLNIAEPVGIGNLLFTNSDELQFVLRVNGALLSQVPKSLTGSQSNEIRITSAGVSVSPDYAFSDGLDSQTLFGYEKTVTSSFHDYSNSTYVATLSVKVPPILHNESEYSVEMQLVLPFRTTSTSDLAVGADQMPLPTAITTLPLTTSYPTLASYGNGVPLIINMTTNSGNSSQGLYYVNVYPTLGNSLNGMLPSFNFITDALSSELSTYDPPAPSIPLPLSGSNGFTFGGMHINGTIDLNASGGYLLPAGDVSASVNGNDSSVPLSAIKEIIPVGADHIQLLADEATISNGQGFYSSIGLTNASIEIKGSDPSALVVSENGSALVLSGRSLTFTANVVEAMLRQPQVNFHGAAEVSELVVYGNLINNFYPQDSSGVVKGHLAFQVQYGDSVSVARNASVAGSYTSQAEISAMNDELFIFRSDYLVSFLIVLALLSVGFVIVAVTRNTLEDGSDDWQ